MQPPIVEFAHVSAGGDITLEVPREGYSPSLQIRLLEPTLIPWVPDPRDPQKDVAAFLESEAARNGVPRFADLTDYVRLNPGDKEARAYVEQLTSWLNVAHYTLTIRHEYETCIARSIFLTFEVTNTGELPAERVAVELRFPLNLSVNKYISQGEDPPELPRQPPSVLAKFRRPASDSPGSLGPWYSTRASQEPPMSAIVNGIELSGSREPNAEAHAFWAHKGRLEHGSSFKTRPIRVNFDYGPVHPFDVDYVLHASNQPTDLIGKFRLKQDHDQPGSSQTQRANH